MLSNSSEFILQFTYTFSDLYSDCRLKPLSCANFHLLDVNLISCEMVDLYIFEPCCPDFDGILFGSQ